MMHVQGFIGNRPGLWNVLHKDIPAKIQCIQWGSNQGIQFVISTLDPIATHDV